MTLRAPPLERLYWPRHALGFACSARASADDWLVDLMRHGLALDSFMEFMVEDVADRFMLCVYQDGRWWTDPYVVPDYPGTWCVTDEGDTAESVDGLVVTCIEANPAYFRYPIKYQCRVVHVREPERYRLTMAGFELEPLGARRGRKHRNRLDRFDLESVVGLH